MSNEGAMQTPLIDLLRMTPMGLRAEWPSQWAENGRETGHTMSPVGKHCHEAANRIAELEQQLAELREGVANAMLCDTVVQMHECLAALQESSDD